MNSDILQRFMGRVKAATAGRSKDVRMPVEEAQELCAALGELMAAKIAQLENNPTDDVIVVVADAGKL